MGLLATVVVLGPRARALANRAAVPSWSRWALMLARVATLPAHAAVETAGP
jgi:hypothetical protein